MKGIKNYFSLFIDRTLNKLGLGLRAKLIIIFLLVKVIPLILLSFIAWRQFSILGGELTGIAVSDCSAALNNIATENIERMTTDTALRIADFLYGRDTDIQFLASIAPGEDAYARFINSKTGKLVSRGQWELSADGRFWMPVNTVKTEGAHVVSGNSENNDMDGFRYRGPESYKYMNVPLYDEITFVDLSGRELVKVVAGTSTKVRYPMSAEKKDISSKENTYVKAEDYFEDLKKLRPGDIYVSDVTGAYVGSNYIGMYTPGIVAEASGQQGHDIEYDPESQAFAGRENPMGARFEGIIRWAAPITDENGAITGYVTMALNHDHLMEFVDHITPMYDRYTEYPSAFEGNYAFIWDYKCRSICHPRHHSIVGFDPETGDPQVPWLESSIYDAWQASGIGKWTDFIRDIPAFDSQSRTKKASPELTRLGLVGLDGRYLNNAPQCTGWMDLTEDGGSGSFYIQWSNIYKLTTAAAIPYYTGRYAPSQANGYSKRGFGFVAIGAGLDDFTRPAAETELRLTATVDEHLWNTTFELSFITGIIIFLVVLIAIWMASFITNNITALINGISRFRAGERQFRFNSPKRDEFATLANSFDDMAESISESIKNPYTITDLNLNVIYSNDHALELWNSTLHDTVGRKYDEVSIYPFGTNYCPITALREGAEAEILYHPQSGRYFRGSANYLLDKDGEKNGYIVETLDLTQMVLEREKIEAQRTLLDKIFTASPDLIWYQDAEGKYLAVNPRFASIAGATDDSFIGKSARAALPAEPAESLGGSDRLAKERESSYYTEERIKFADGHEELLDCVRTPIFDTGGQLAGLLGFARDVTVRAEMERRLRKTQAELEQAVLTANEANRHKGDFLARMSHEIRTPMNAIIGITNIALKKLEDFSQDSRQMDELKGHIRQIENSSQHLLGLLNDILDISKIEAGKIELSEEPMEIGKLTSAVVGIIRPRCDEKNIKFITGFDTLPCPCFLGDPLRLRQVLINLLGNAVKFTPDLGEIEFEIRLLDRTEGRSLIEFSVRDSGVGISEADQALIFQPFEQGSGASIKKSGGTGLGLAISKRIVQLFGGDITLESEPGKGSTFLFRLWLRETDSCGPDEMTSLSDITGLFKGKRALLVDDVDINRMIVASILEPSEMLIDEAGDGRDAVDTFAASPEFYYDIILMDVKMPIMDGYEASKAIRELPRTDSSVTPIIALTANAFKDDIDKAMSHGMNAHVAKPVEETALIDVLYKFLQ